MTDSIDITPVGVKKDPERVNKALAEVQEMNYLCYVAMSNFLRNFDDIFRIDDITRKLEEYGYDVQYFLELGHEMRDADESRNQAFDAFLRAVAGR